MDVLSSRILPRPSDLDRSRRFYRDLPGLARLERCGENQVSAGTERQPGQHVRLGVGERRARISPRAGPPPSFTWLRAEQTISPAGVDTQAPTAMFPVRSASHAWRNASCHGLASPARTCAAAADKAAGSRSTA